MRRSAAWPAPIDAFAASVIFAVADFSPPGEPVVFVTVIH